MQLPPIFYSGDWLRTEQETTWWLSKNDQNLTFSFADCEQKVNLWPLFNNDHLAVHSILHCFLQIMFQSNCVPILSRSIWKLYLNCKCKMVKDFLQSRTLDLMGLKFSRNLSISHSAIHNFFSKKLQWQKWEKCITNSYRLIWIC